MAWLAAVDCKYEEVQRVIRGNTGGNTAARRVLIIDDDQDLLAVLTEGLRVIGGIDVITATDGAGGLIRYYETLPDCVVVDIRMPGINGYQFVRVLRGDPSTARTPVIVLSGLTQDHQALAGMLAGADVYLFKPVRIFELLRAIEQAIHLTEGQRRQRQRAFATGLPVSSGRPTMPPGPEQR